MKPIIMVNKAHVTLMGREYVDEELAFACGKCGNIMPTKELATTHCELNKCQDCGKDVDLYHYIRCNSCMLKRDRKKMAKAAEKATKVPMTYDRPVFVEDLEGHPVGGNGNVEGYYNDVYSAIEDLVDEEFVPESFYVWGSYSSFMRFNANHIIEAGLEEHHEDADVSQKATNELQDFLDSWCEENVVETFYPDYNVRITGVDEEVGKQRQEQEEEQEE